MNIIISMAEYERDGRGLDLYLCDPDSEIFLKVSRSEDPKIRGI
jgi:hypothetical protein